MHGYFGNGIGKFLIRKVRLRSMQERLQTVESHRKRQSLKIKPVDVLSYHTVDVKIVEESDQTD